MILTWMILLLVKYDTVCVAIVNNASVRRGSVLEKRSLVERTDRELEINVPISEQCVIPCHSA